MTAVSVAGVLSATGWLAGQAAADQVRVDAQKKAREQQAAQQQRRARLEWRRQWRAAQARARAHVVWKDRRVVTVVDTRVVHAARVGPGGTVSSSAPTYSAAGGSTSYASGSASAGGSGGHAAPAPAPRPVAPPPPPPPAKSSGS